MYSCGIVGANNKDCFGLSGFSKKSRSCIYKDFVEIDRKLVMSSILIVLRKVYSYCELILYL